MNSGLSPPEETIKQLKKLDDLVDGGHAPLLKIQAVFPFDFFPDEIIVDSAKVNIVQRDFFMSEDIHSILIDMIKDVALESGPLFATLKIVPDGYPGQPLSVRYLKKDEALRARRIIQGLMVGVKRGVDMSKIEHPHLKRNIEAVGKAPIIE